MENTVSTKVSSAKTPVSLGDRFAFHTWHAVPIIIVLLLVGFRVYVRGNHASEGLLGRPLRVGIVSWPGYAGGLIANNGLRPNKDSDFWNKHNLLVEFVLIEDEDALHRDFARGGENDGVDVMWSTVDSLAHQSPEFLEEGIQPRAFMQVDWSRGGDAIIASAGIDRIEDLKGKKIAVSMPASQWLLEYNLEHSSLTENEKKQIRQNRRKSKGSQEARELFVDGIVDAAVLWEPDVTAALKRRGRRLVDTSIAANLIADVMVAKETFIGKYPKVIRAFIEGWLLDGTTKAISDPMSAANVLLGEPSFAALGEETTQSLIGKVSWATLNDNAKMFGLSGGDDADFDRLFSEASKLWVKAGYMSDETPAEQARDSSFLQEIYNARQGPLARRPEIQTIELAIVFPPGKAELSLEARRTLDGQDIVRRHSGALFCVQASADEGDDAQHGLDIRRARENVVIEYLAEHFDCPPSQFLSAGATNCEAANGGRGAPLVRLKLIIRASVKQ